MSGFSLKFLQDVNRMMNESRYLNPGQAVSVNSEDEFYRKEGEDMSLIYGPTRKPVRNKKEFVEQIADKFDLEYNQVYAEIRKLEIKKKPIDIDVLHDELRKLKGGH